MYWTEFFKMKGTTFERLTTKFTYLIHYFVYDCIVKEVGTLQYMADLSK